MAVPKRKTTKSRAGKRRSHLKVSSKNIIEEEAKALLLLSKSLDTNYNKVLSLVSKTKGNIILSGVGKSGHIA